MLLLTGASASGKTEAAKILRHRHGLSKAVTHTTRPPRVGEKDKVDYFFVSEEEFLKKEERGFFVETTCYNHNHYGCGKDQVADGNIVVVDPNGLRSFLALDDDTIITFYLEASERTRIARMKSRGDTRENIAKRIINDRTEFRPANIAKTDFVILTDDRPLLDIAEEIYGKYKEELARRLNGR